VPRIEVDARQRHLVERLYGVTVEDQLRSEKCLESDDSNLSFLSKYIPVEWSGYYNAYGSNGHEDVLSFRGWANRANDGDLAGETSRLFAEY